MLVPSNSLMVKVYITLILLRRVNMDLIDETGDSFDIMLTHFRIPAVARIFNITDASGDTFTQVSAFLALYSRIQDTFTLFTETFMGLSKTQINGHTLKTGDFFLT